MRAEQVVTNMLSDGARQPSYDELWAVLENVVESAGVVLGAAMYGEQPPWEEHETVLRHAQFVLTGDAHWIERTTDA